MSFPYLAVVDFQTNKWYRGSKVVMGVIVFLWPSGLKSCIIQGAKGKSGEIDI